jgi:hypothetical protein
MQRLYSAQIQAAPDVDVPFETQQAVLEHLHVDEQNRLKQTGEQGANVLALKDAYRQELVDLMGAERYQAFRARIRALRDAQVERLQPPHGPELSDEELARLQAERREAAEAYLREIGVDSGQLREVSKRFGERLTTLITSVSSRDNYSGELVLPADVPAEIRSDTPNPWSIIRPPYFRGGWSYDGWDGAFTFTPTLYLDPAAGLVGNTNDLVDSDATDFDWGFIGYNTWIGFWYRMPATGLVEAWVEAQSAYSHHHLRFSDEFGWSDAFNYQDAAMGTRADGDSQGEWVFTTMSWMEGNGDSGHWDNQYLTPGNTYWAHTFSDLSFPKDSSVYIRAGARNYNAAFADDVSVYATLKARWFIKSVRVHSTGD